MKYKNKQVYHYGKNKYFQFDHHWELSNTCLRISLLLHKSSPQYLLKSKKHMKNILVGHNFAM